MSKRDGIFKRKGRAGFNISYTDQSGKRRQQKVHALTHKEAELLRAAILTRIEQAKILGIAPPSNELFEQVARRFLDYQRIQLSQGAYNRTESIVRVHLMPRFQGREFAEISRSDLERYVIQRAQEVKPDTVKKEFTTIERLWSLATAWQTIPVNIALGIQTPKLPPDRVRYLEPAQLPHLLECCPDWLRPIVVFAISTGLRRSEFCNLRYMDVSREQSRLFLQKTKSGKPRGVPLNETAKLALDTVWNPEAKPTEKIFTNYQLDYVTSAFIKARNKAGIPDFRLHDLRHTFASWLAMKDVTIQKISELLGHSNIQITMKYAHLSPSYVGDASNRIDSVFMPELIKEEQRLFEGKRETE
ncbi:MAG: site-specific integrase [Acidobacteria bacterium]|nr:site-specific integrase [Acidobacteriota bacterium]